MALVTLFLFCAVAAADAVIDTDVAIIGGGASGAYAAVRLREDYGKNIVVVEKQNRLGGHTNTWYDPTTKTPFDYGVEVFTNISASRDFFARFNIPVGTPSFAQSQPLYADFATGSAVNYTAPSAADVSDAMARWHEQWLRYQGLMLPTSLNFPTGADIPADLLLTWNEFAQKYRLAAAGPSIYSTVVVNLEAALMVDVWKAHASPGTGSGFQPASGDNSELYDSAARLLGGDVLYESQVVSAKRSAAGVQLRVQGADGRVTEVNARRLLVTVGPETLGQAAFDLDADEADVFSSTSGERYYTGIVSHPSLPARTVRNTAPGAAAGGYLAYPAVPALSGFSYVGNSSAGPVHRTVLLVPRGTGLEGARALVRGSLQNLMDAGTVPAGDAAQLDFKAFEDHGALYRRWTADQLRDGVVSRANALQGLRSTWYTGAFWMNNDSAMLWNTTDSIIRRVLEGI